MVDPLMHHDIVNCGTLGRVRVEDLGDEVAGVVADGHVFGEAVGVHPNALVGCLNVASLEGWLADDQGVDDDTDGPDIDLVRVTLLALKHLRSDIVRSTANGALALSVELEFRGETEVTDLDFHLVVQEEVTQLQVTMDDSVAMKVLHRCTDLVDVALDFELMKTLTAT